jgi:hypothetical protein
MGDLNVTSQLDQILAGYDAVTLTIYITLAVIVIALIVLGSEFWVNLWGTIVYPAMTFQRLLGEAQWVPALVIVAISGMATAAILLTYFQKPEALSKILELFSSTNPGVSSASTQLDQLFGQVGSDFSLTGNLDYIKEFSFQAGTVIAFLPISYLVTWFLWGLAGQLASMIAGNKAGHGISNLWSAIPYVFLLSILTNWFSMLELAGHQWVRIPRILVQLYYLFLIVVLMREHGRYKISSAIIATILTFPLLIAMTVILVIAVLFIAVMAAQYL